MLIYIFTEISSECDSETYVFELRKWIIRCILWNCKKLEIVVEICEANNVSTFPAIVETNLGNLNGDNEEEQTKAEN